MYERTEAPRPLARTESDSPSVRGDRSRHVVARGKMRLVRVPASIAVVAAVCLLITSAGMAEPTWPANDAWNPVTTAGGTGLYIDAAYFVPGNPNGDEYHVNPPSGPRDLVGGIDEHGNPSNPAGAGLPYATAFWSYDGTNVMSRLRVDQDPNIGGQFVWSTLLDIDGDDLADYVIQLDLSSDNQVELATVTAWDDADNATPLPGNNWVLTLPDTTHIGAQTSSGTAATAWYKFENATAIDGSHFHDTQPETDDYFVDFAFPYADLIANTPLEDGAPFRVAATTSSTHTSTIIDVPDGGWSDPIPEPTTMSLLGIGALALIKRRRK